MKLKCNVCGYIYDPEAGDPDGDVRAGTYFDNLPLDWVCPDCGASQDIFEIIDDDFEEEGGEEDE